MHEEKIALVDGQVKAVQQAVAARAVENVYFVACGGSLATLYPGKYILERETAAVSTGAYTAAEFLNDPPARLGEKSLVVLNSQSGGTPETAAAARLAAGRGALTAAFTTTPGSALEQAADHIVYYFDDPASPYPAVLTIFPEVYKLTYALLDVWNGTGRLPEVNAAMLRLQDTFDEACAAYRPAARAFGAKYAGEPILYSIAAGLDACVGYVLTNCLVMESLWKHSSPLHAGEFFHGAREAVDDTAAVFALLGPGGTRGEVFTAQDREADGAGRGRAGSRGLSRLAACAGIRTGAQPSGRAVLRRDVLCDGTPYFLAPVHGGGKILMKLLGIGDNVLDDYRWRQELYPGGNSVNVPVLARRYDGSTAAYIGVLADDGAGLHFASALREEGVDISRVRVMHGVSARNYIELDEAGDRHFVGNNGRETAQYQALLCLTPGDYAMMEQYDLAHTSIHSWLDAYHPAISRRVPLSLDFSGEYDRVNIAQLCPLLRFAFFAGGAASEEEVRALARTALDAGARTVVVTMGVRGSYLLEQGREHRQECVRADVVDALGAGDAFIAAFLAEYHAGGGDLADAAQKASVFAAQCCGHYGAFGHAMPHPDRCAGEQADLCL